MPRQARIDATGALHHVICRGIERKRIFMDDADLDHFVERLGSVLLKSSTACFAWALLPNHFHLLLRTGREPIATVMRRLLTGYAVYFNRRHNRHGHLFPNRYKSILCQEDPYLFELVRYIHLNPLRARLVTDIEGLEHYPYSGHSRLIGKYASDWQDTKTVLSLFSEKVRTARCLYREYVKKGLSIGKRKELTGGGLLRSTDGWEVLKDMRQVGYAL